ncbi:MAG: hypothetical protein QGI56_08620 [Dehalococcoidia bacterium]|nr:hypothetical protein [Dehalococcoidia bacterium]
MTFRDREKERYKALKPLLFSENAQRDGTYRGRPRSFCLADDCSSENLYSGIRASAIQYFADRRISWHDGLDRRRVPSNHLCCSQSCCVNFLYPMAGDPALVEAVLGVFFPELAKAVPVYEDGLLPSGSAPYMAFEWIGSRDYLGEQKRKGGRRTRGANFTSAGFAFRFIRNDGKVQLVLGEWKYTESYGSSDLGIPVRKANYQRAFDRADGVFGPQRRDLYDALFFDPFYQLMRLQLLAQEMETGKLGREMDADVVSVLHICPAANGEFREHVTSPQLKAMLPGKGTLDIWKDLVPEDRFLSISVEDLLEAIVRDEGSIDRDWVRCLGDRYRW